MRFFIYFSYNGTKYHGWQIQPNAITVQQILEKSISVILNKKIKLVGAGRTDTGVHAKMMTAHFDSEININNKKKIIYLLNSYLNSDISIIDLKSVTDKAHARFDAISRTYEYHISSLKDPFNKEFTYYFRESLDIDLMNKASGILLKYSNFKSFTKSNTDLKTFDCKIIKAKWSTKKNGFIFTIIANRFLRNMVRAIVGTLLNVGLKKITLMDFSRIIESKNRSIASYSAPAKGLFLAEIDYPKFLFKND